MRLAVLISGRGSNLGALIDQLDKLPAPIALVLSDQPEAGGLALARTAGIEVAVCPRAKGQSKQSHETDIAQALQEASITHILLAGFMRLLSAEFIGKWQAVLNIHPSLLPAFPGLDTHARALAAGARVHGCTVHQVDAGMDTGPIVAQAVLAVRADEDADALAARVLRLEHALYAAAIGNFLAGPAQNQAP